jgi:hypothetical protein
MGIKLSTIDGSPVSSTYSPGWLDQTHLFQCPVEDTFQHVPIDSISNRRQFPLLDTEYAPTHRHYDYPGVSPSDCYGFYFTRRCDVLITPCNRPSDPANGYFALVVGNRSVYKSKVKSGQPIATEWWLAKIKSVDDSKQTVTLSL